MRSRGRKFSCTGPSCGSSGRVSTTAILLLLHEACVVVLVSTILTPIWALGHSPGQIRMASRQIPPATRSVAAGPLLRLLRPPGSPGSWGRSGRIYAPPTTPATLLWENTVGIPYGRPLPTGSGLLLATGVVSPAPPFNFAIELGRRGPPLITRAVENFPMVLACASMDGIAANAPTHRDMTVRPVSTPDHSICEPDGLC